MALRFQYNKTALQEINRQLRIRVRALPTLKNKESALRMEVKKLKQEADEREALLNHQMAAYQEGMRLWAEFDSDIVRVAELELTHRKIAGVRIPELKAVWFQVAEHSLFNKPHWLPDGIRALQEMTRTGIEKEVLLCAMNLLDRARKKTTQKVNLYEKVQIPAYEEAALKIKRFLEDEENLSKSAQKIVKKRQETHE